MTQASDLGAVAGGQSGLLVRTALNTNLQALATECEGNTAPSPAYPFLRWRNDTAKLLYRRNGANSGWTIEQNYGATTDPGTGDDAADGYVRGSVWINVVGNRWFVCTDPTSSAAVWLQLGGMGTISSTDAGAGEGPLLSLDRNSGSPAANDMLGALVMLARSSTGVQRTAAKIVAQLLDPTNGSENTALILRTMVAGALATRVTIGQGLVVGSASDSGPGLINAQNGYYRGGAPLPFQKWFESTEQTITLGGSLTIAHGLGVEPTFYFPYLVCKTAEQGYSVGDHTPLLAATGNFATSVVPDLTNITVRFSSGSPYVANKTTGGTVNIAAANWKLVVRAWV